MNPVISRNGVPVRLTDERWVHIVENHDDLAGKRDAILEAIADPDFVLTGTREELLAVRYGEKPRVIVVVYREMAQTDGFIITAFETSRVRQLIKTRKMLWKKRQSKRHSA